MSRHAAWTVLVLVLVFVGLVVSAGCGGEGAIATSDDPAGKPDQLLPTTPTSPQALPAGPVCKVEDGSCCRDGECNDMQADCAEGFESQFLGCDADCQALASCEQLPCVEKDGACCRGELCSSSAGMQIMCAEGHAGQVDGCTDTCVPKLGCVQLPCVP